MATSKILFGKNTTFPTSLTSAWSVVDAESNVDSIQNVIDDYADGNEYGGNPYGNLATHTSEDAVVVEIAEKRDYFDGHLMYFFMNGDHYQEYLNGTRAFKDIQHSNCYQINKGFFAPTINPYPPADGTSTANYVAVKYGADDSVVEVTCFIGRMYGSATNVTTSILVSDMGNPRTRTNVLTEEYTIDEDVFSNYTKSELVSNYGFDLSSWGLENSMNLAKVVITAPSGETIDTTKTFYIGFCMKIDAEDTEDTGIIRTKACYKITPAKMTNPDGTYE